MGVIDGHIPPLENDYLEKVVADALREDIGHGDLTTDALVEASAAISAQVIAGQEAVLAGMDVFCRVFRHLDASAGFHLHVQEGDRIAKGQVILEVSAKAEAVLKGERTALNFMQRMSGVATRTRLFLDKLKGLPVTLLDTRKTTPGLRPLEKYAVRVAGGGNHRFGLFDGILIKDNHRKLVKDLAEAVSRLKKLFPLGRVEIECADMDEVAEALAAGADILLLDNMSLNDMARTVRIVRGRCLLEASGNIELDNIRRVAKTGVNYISAGTIIHGATFVDLSLEVIG